MIDWAEQWAANSEMQQVRDSSNGDTWEKHKWKGWKQMTKERMEIKTYLIWYIHYSYF